MSIFQWNSDYYRSNDESENINDILQREQRIREFSKLTDAAEAAQQLYEDSVSVGGSFYNSLILDEEPSYDRMVTEYIKQRDLLFGATEQETQEQDFSLGKRTPSLIVTERGLEVGALEVPTGIGALDPNRDVMWYQTWGTGESNRSIFVTNAQASYLRSQLYATSPFTQRALSSLTPQERQLIPEVPPDIQDRIQTWQQYTNNWERTIASVVELAPPVMIARGIQGKLPSFDGIPLFDQFQRTPDEFFGGYRDPNFKGKAVLELLKKYEPERYQYLLATGMEFSKLDNAKSIFDFQYEMNEHIMRVATTNALLDYQASDPGWFKDSWAMYARPFISGTFNDGDMPADLVITAATWGYGGAYVIGKNIPRFWKGATTGKRIENTVRMIDSLQDFKKFQERAAWFTPTNWATIALNRGTRNFAENLAQMGTKGKIGSYVAYNLVQGAFEGAAYYQLNYMMNIGTNAEYNWDGVQFLKEIAGEAVGQVALGATMNYITSAGIQATMWTGKQMWDSFTPGNIGVEIEPSKIKRLFRDVSTSLNIDPEKWDLLSPEEKKEVAAAIDLNMQLQNLLEIVEGREDTTPYIINAIWGSYENSINKAIAVDALKEVALVIQGRTDDSKLDPKTKEFIKAVKDKYGDKLSSLQIGALLLEAVQIRTSQAMMDGSTRVTDNDASQILGQLMILSVLEDKAKETNVKLTTENVKEIHEALKNEGEEKMTERFTQKENELMGLAELRSGGSRVDIKSDSDLELTAADQAAIDRILRLKPNEKISPAITTSEGEQAIAEARRLERERDEATEQLIREARARDEEADAPEEAQAAEGDQKPLGWALLEEIYGNASEEAPEAKVIETKEPEVVAPEAAPEVSEASASVTSTSNQVENLTQDEFAEYLRENGLPDGVAINEASIYDVLIRRPNLRHLSKDEFVQYFMSIGGPKKARQIILPFRELWSKLRPSGIKIDGISAIGQESDWTNFEIGSGTGEKGNSPKAYATLSDPLALTPEKLLEFMKLLRDNGYNGQLKIPGGGSRFMMSFDNIVMHGATDADAQLAKNLAEKFFGSELLGTMLGKDGEGTSHTKLLARQVLKDLKDRTKTPSADSKTTSITPSDPEAVAPETTVTEDKPSTVDIDAQIQTTLEAVVSLNPEQQTIANQILEGMTQENILFKLETLMKEIPETADVLKVIKDC